LRRLFRVITDAVYSFVSADAICRTVVHTLGTPQQMQFAGQLFTPLAAADISLLLSS
jgi:hypothetical protein